MPIDPLPSLATFAAILGLGFLGYLLFERTRVTDVLILIAFGVIVGPVLKVFSPEGFQDASVLMGTVALIVIMFDGGLGLHLRDLLSGIARSTVLAVAGFTLTVSAVALAGRYAMGLDWSAAILLGAILGGTSGVIVMPIIARTSAAPGTRVLLSVESALTDVLCVIGVVTLLGVLTAGAGVGPGQLSGAVKAVAAQFSVAIVLGMAAGFAWMRVLKALEGKKNAYMATLAAVLGLYVGAEAVGGNGAIGVLIFGVVLGNGTLLAAKLRFEGLSFSKGQLEFQGEIVFLIRSFFFVYLGVILDPAILADPRLLLESALLLGAILLARVLAVGLSTWRDAETRPDRGLMVGLLPRGLAAVVLAGLPAAAGIPGSERFLAYAFVVVAATNLVGTFAVVGYERGRSRRVPVGGRPAAAAPEASRKP